MLVTPDFTDAQDELAPGEYKVRITGCKEKVSQKGAKYLSWELSTFGEEDPKNEGRKVWHTTMLSGPGAGMLKKFYKVCTGDDIDASFDTEQLLSKELAIVVAPSDRGGMNVKAVKPIQ